MQSQFGSLGERSLLTWSSAVNLLGVPVDLPVVPIGFSSRFDHFPGGFPFKIDRYGTAPAARTAQLAVWFSRPSGPPAGPAVRPSLRSGCRAQPRGSRGEPCGSRTGILRGVEEGVRKHQFLINFWPIWGPFGPTIHQTVVTDGFLSFFCAFLALQMSIFPPKTRISMYFP